MTLTGVGMPLLILMLALLQGCASGGRAPVSGPGGAGETRRDASMPYSTSEQRKVPASGHHVVSRGDTLYSIAWRYGLDYRQLARWNDIGSSYTIYPGDRLRLSAPAGNSMAAVARASRQSPTPPIKRSDKPSPPLPRAQSSTPPSPPITGTANKPETTKQAVNAPAATASGPIQWRWPTNGKLVDANSPTGEKGIQISGKLDQPVIAAAGGQVVYSGSGLIGYGKLIIVKHNDTYLSAYAHNKELLVKEGDSVQGGQQIATMGAASDGRAALHFEIRRNGQPIDPLQHLPRRQG